MTQINLTNYNLDTKGASKLAFELHKNSKDLGFTEKVIEQFGLDLLVGTKNSGLISNILNWLITVGNTQMINQLVSKVNDTSNFKLMKRDFMSLICYFYHLDYSKAQMYFEKDILSKKSDTNASIIQTKEIDFILAHGLNKLLKYLPGLFINTGHNYTNPIVQADGNFRKFTIKPELQSYLLSQIEKSLGNYTKTIRKFNEQIIKPYRAIIDAGNVLHGRKGKITSESINDLEIIIDKTRKTIGEPLVVIHKKHIKSYIKLQEVLVKTDVTYFLTPYNFNDDVFIMWFFVKSGCLTWIISNDKYRDHIYNFQNTLKNYNKQDESSLCEFSNVINEQTLTYNLELNQIQPIQPYSNCIQTIGKFAYIPHTFGGFIKVQIE